MSPAIRCAQPAAAGLTANVAWHAAMQLIMYTLYAIGSSFPPSSSLAGLSGLSASADRLTISSSGTNTAFRMASKVTTAADAMLATLPSEKAVGSSELVLLVGMLLCCRLPSYAVMMSDSSCRVWVTCGGGVGNVGHICSNSSVIRKHCLGTADNRLTPY
eukprot:GHRR01035340.1.p1 GENE.GHRR01035340.1~~GHRR01035340.1.p1  ORF type:complete len:160 (-),score=41.56 GHRR01035340.1:581-1060(-)